MSIASAVKSQLESEDRIIKVKYLADGLMPLEKITQGDWIDLRSAEDITLEPMEFRLIRLGVAMELPKGYEALVVPRSSTFSNFGILMTNSVGVIDETYCGDTDEWRFPALAIRHTEIHRNDRICQFRIIRHQPDNIDFLRVTALGNESRGGIGSTGIV